MKGSSLAWSIGNWQSTIDNQGKTLLKFHELHFLWEFNDEDDWNFTKIEHAKIDFEERLSLEPIPTNAARELSNIVTVSRNGEHSSK